MGLKKLVLAGGMVLTALGSCKTQEVFRRSWIEGTPAEMPVVELNYIYEEKGIEEVTVAQYEGKREKFFFYKHALVIPDLNKEMGQGDFKWLRERTNGYSTILTGHHVSKFMEEKGIEMDLKGFESDGVNFFNETNEKTLIKVLEGCLEEGKNTGNIDKYGSARSYCNVNANSNFSMFSNYSGNGLIIGERYVLTLANLIYQKAMESEFKENYDLEGKYGVKITVAKNIDLKQQGSARSYRTNLIAVNLLKNLALLEIKDEDFEPYGVNLKLSKNKFLELAYLANNREQDLSNRWNLEEVVKEFESEGFAKEIERALALGYGISTIKSTSDMNGRGLFNERGLAGLIIGDLRTTSAFSVTKMYERSTVIPANVIREFFNEVISDVKSGEKSKLTIFKKKLEEPVIPEVTGPVIPEVTEPLVPTGTEDIEESFLEPTLEVPREPINPWPILVFLGLAGTIGTLYGRYKYIQFLKENPNFEESYKRITKEELEAASRRAEEMIADLDKQLVLFEMDNSDAVTLASGIMLPNMSEIALRAKLESGSQETVDEAYDLDDLEAALHRHQNKNAYADAGGDEKTVMGIPGETIPLASEMNITAEDKSLFINKWMEENIDDISWLSEETKTRIAKLMYGYKEEIYKKKE